MLFDSMRHALHLLSPETAHCIALSALKHGLVPGRRTKERPMLAQSLFGVDFPNPVGLAAGFDKNAEAVDALLKQGFGYVEAGTVTPRAQSGNPTPRIFRLRRDQAVINRLGFNNQGAEYFLRQMKKHAGRPGVVGGNIGRNRDSEDAVADYVSLLRELYGVCDYITLNVSSPNTQGLRAMQQRRALEGLLSALMEERATLEQESKRRVPLLLKIAPDLEAHEMEDIAQAVVEKQVDGVIVSNTTIRRPKTLASSARSESGGLSGKPVFEISTQVLGRMYALTQGKVPLIGVGGIASGADAYAKIRAGASLVQLYTALIYQGFGLVEQICDELEELLTRDGFSHLKDAVGADHSAGDSTFSHASTVMS